MKKISSSFVLLCGLSISCAALADPSSTIDHHQYDNVYASVLGGAAMMPDIDETNSLNDPIKKEIDTGTFAALALGLKSGLGRYEIEVFNTKSDINKIEINSLSLDASGDVEATGYMLNAYLDLDFIDGKFMPYVGVGLGSMHLDDDFTAESFLGMVSESEKADSVFVWQPIVGVMYHFTHNLAVSLDDRYMMSGDIDYKGTDTSGEDYTLTQKYQNNIVDLGVSYYFG